MEISGRVLDCKQQAEDIVADARRKAAELVASAESEAADLALGAVPVLGGEGVEGNVANAVVGEAFDNAAEVFGTGAVAGQAGEPS